MSFFNKTILTLSFFSCFLSSLSAQDNVIDEIAWVVGDEAILKSDIEKIRLQMQLEREQIDGDPYCLIPEQLAVQKLFLHQAKIDSINVPDNTVNQTINRRIANAVASLGSKEKLEEYLGKSIVELREEWKEQAKDNEIIKEVQQKIVGSVKLTPSEIRNYYTQAPHDSLPYIPTTVEVQIITQNPQIPISEIDAVKNKLRELTERVNKKETDFATLALLYSEDTESAKRGGELGFMGRAELVPSFANAAFMLNNPDRVSNIVESEYGYHIIQFIARRGDKINVRHILLKPKVSAEAIQQTTAKMDSIYNDINSKKISFDNVTALISADKDTRNNKGIMINQNHYSNYGGTARFEMKDLPQEVAKVVATLNENEISKPFSMTNSKGKDVVAIVKLKQKVSAHRANLNDDYQIIKTIAENNKREEIITKWVDNKIKSTYVKINDDWKNCDFRHSGWIKNNQ